MLLESEIKELRKLRKVHKLLAYSKLSSVASIFKSVIIDIHLVASELFYWIRKMTQPMNIQWLVDLDTTSTNSFKRWDVNMVDHILILG